MEVMLFQIMIIQQMIEEVLYGLSCLFIISSRIDGMHFMLPIQLAKPLNRIIPLVEYGIPYLKNPRSEEHTSELQSRGHLVCRLLLEKKKINQQATPPT